MRFDIIEERLSRTINCHAQTDDSEEVRNERKRCLHAAAHWVADNYPHRTVLDWVVTAAMCMVVLGLLVILHTLIGYFFPGLPSEFYAALTTALTGLYLWASVSIVRTTP